jgi:LuxR family quorum sensing-dependent transcriptional regulator
MRDGIVCPIGGRWVLSFWSRKVLTPEVLPVEARALVFMAVCFALMRVEALLQPDPGRIPSRARLTARETAVVRLAAAGRDMA